MLKTYFLLFFIFISNNIYSQYYLELRKATKLKSFNFYPGDNIRFKIKDDFIFSRAYITGISQDMLRFNYIEVPISDIEIIDISNKSSNFFKKTGNLISVVSVGFFFIDMINSTLVQKNKYKDVYDKNFLISCSLGLTIGYSLRLSKRKYFIKKGLNRIWVKKSF